MISQRLPTTSIISLPPLTDLFMHGLSFEPPEKWDDPQMTACYVAQQTLKICV